MSRNRVMRGALWAAVLLNVAGLAVFIPPALGFAPEMLPIPGPPFYAAQVALTIALFGGVYAWLARQPQINRPLVLVGALGKLGFSCSPSRTGCPATFRPVRCRKPRRTSSSR